MSRHFILFLACQLVIAIFFVCPRSHADCFCGDFNDDGVVNLADPIYLMDYCFIEGPPPECDPDSVDADEYEFLNIRDAVYVITYIYYGGLPPTCPPANPEYQPVLEPSDTIEIPRQTLQSGDSLISVPIWYKNSESIRGIALPLKVRVGEQIPRIDSVALGARIASSLDRITIDNLTGSVNSGFLWAQFNDSLAPGSGTMLTLYLYTPPESFDREVLIDTVRLAPFNSSLFIKSNLDGVLPVFVGFFGPDSIPFAPAVNYGAGDGSRLPFCADLDGDSDLDLVTVNYLSDSVSILKNNGNGTFLTNMDYAVGDYPARVFCADLDGDSDLDLAVANESSNDVSILKNYGDGTFQTKVDYGVGDYPGHVFCADLDGDADLDLAVANQNSDNVSILKNNGDGTFQTKVDYGAGDGPGSIFCADLDGDGDLDLAVANGGGNDVSILKNNGDGSFLSPVNYGTGDNPVSPFCADLDGDSDLDLALANWDSNSVSILRNNGDGSFLTKVDYGVGLRPTTVFCADLDGDTDFDLAVANAYSDNVSILKNYGDGTFQTKVDYGAGDGPSCFCADLDGDGDLDLAVSNSGDDNVSILKNLTQIPVNQPPWAFSLITPADEDTTFGSTTFQWQIPYDPNFGDQMRYDLYLSTSPGFEEPTIHSNLPVSKFTTVMESGTYYWKVDAKDNWGAETWSTETWSFAVRPLFDTLWIIAYSPVDLTVTDPVGDSIGLEFNTIQDADYDTTVDWNEDGDSDDLITIPHPYVGEYQIEVIREDDVAPDDTTYDLGIRINGSDMTMVADDEPLPPPDGSSDYSYDCLTHLRGDANGDDQTNSADIVFLINYLFKSGPASDPVELGDVNCDGVVNSADVVYLINYLFKGGPPPCS